MVKTENAFGGTSFGDKIEGCVGSPGSFNHLWYSPLVVWGWSEWKAFGGFLGETGEPQAWTLVLVVTTLRCGGTRLWLGLARSVFPRYGA